MAEKLTAEQLNTIDHEVLKVLFLNQQEQLEALRKVAEEQSQKLDEANRKIDKLIEQLAVANNNRYGRSSEKLSVIEGQQELDIIFNEAEALIENKYVLEPEIEDVVTYTRKKQKGKRDEDLSNLPCEVIEHKLTNEQLTEIFGSNGWKELPDEVYRRVRIQPAVYTVEEHHVGVYAGKDNQTMVKGNRPKDLLRNSVATPSIVASIMNAKYVNGLPIERISKEYERNEIHISKQVMSHWMILCAERYLGPLYDYLHLKMHDYHVLQADETPVNVSKDGRPANSKSYMWVYRTGKSYKDTPIILYEYQRTRKAEAPEEFFKGFHGVVVTDGYSVYQSMDRSHEEITFAGCWAHARRRFAEAIKALPANHKGDEKGSIANQALKLIAAIYRENNELDKLSAKERLNQRQSVVKPLVEVYFAWLKSVEINTVLSAKTKEGINYSLNHEKQLKVFLDEPDVPMDNNSTEGALRSFCLHKHTWKLIDTVDGAKSSAIIYSIVETAKANNLHPFRYLEHLLTVMKDHQEDTDRSFLEELLPWSASLPEICRLQNRKKNKKIMRPR